jgi:hypothetical protein
MRLGRMCSRAWRTRRSTQIGEYTRCFLAFRTQAKVIDGQSGLFPALSDAQCDGKGDKFAASHRYATDKFIAPMPSISAFIVSPGASCC